MERNSLWMTRGSSKCNFPSLTWWKSSIITGIFMVLAAWKESSARRKYSDLASKVRKATATSACEAAIRFSICWGAAASLASCGRAGMQKRNAVDANAATIRVRIAPPRQWCSRKQAATRIALAGKMPALPTLRDGHTYRGHIVAVNVEKRLLAIQV